MHITPDYTDLLAKARAAKAASPYEYLVIAEFRKAASPDVLIALVTELQTAMNEIADLHNDLYRLSTKTSEERRLLDENKRLRGALKRLAKGDYHEESNPQWTEENDPQFIARAALANET